MGEKKQLQGAIEITSVWDLNHFPFASSSNNNNLPSCSKLAALMEQACMTVKDSVLRVYVLQIMPNIKTETTTVDKGFIPVL